MAFLRFARYEPIVFYGLRAFEKVEESSLTEFERKVLRKVYGPIGSIVKPTNRENCLIMNYKIKFQNPNIVKENAKRILTCLAQAKIFE